jgi:hypothetical protein
VPTTASLRVDKSFPYLGGTRIFSNRYHFDGTTPTDSGHWTTLSDAVVTAEKACYAASPVTTQIIKTVGFAPGSEVPVFQKTYATNGTLAPAGTIPAAPGDAALLVRYSTATRTSKNHPLYLFNYYHGLYTNGVSSQDYPWATQKTALATYAAAWITGFSDGTATHHRTGPNGDVATGVLVGTYITHRDFPRG